MDNLAMNNMYPGEVYTIRGDMGYDNKIMLNTSTPSMHQHQQHIVDVPANETTSKSRRRWRSRIRRPLVIDLIIAVVVSTVTAIGEYGLIPGTRQGFYCKDPSLNFPFQGDTISIATVIVVMVLAPVFFLVLVETIRVESFWKVRSGVALIWYKQYLVWLSVVLFLTEAIKIAFGEHRPHFFYSCVPDSAEGCVTGTFIEEYRCTNKDVSAYFLTDSSRSFLSGHASSAAFSAVFCAAYIQWRLPTRKTGYLFKCLLITLCLTWACLCSLSRITDRRHHWWDVLAGMVLGTIGAIYGIFMVYRDLRVKKIPRPSPSTTTLLDEKNKDAITVAI